MRGDQTVKAYPGVGFLVPKTLNIGEGINLTIYALICTLPIAKIICLHHDQEVFVATTECNFRLAAAV